MRIEKNNRRSWVGLTGGMGSGKSTVLAMFKRKGAFTLDSDAIVHQLLAKDQKVLGVIRKKMGASVFLGGRNLEKRALAKVVFSSIAKKRMLEKILHPLVRRKILKELERNRRPVAVVDVPLLYESGWQKYFGKVIVVNAGMAHRLRRLENKGFEPSDVKRRIKAQWPLRKKIRLADFVVNNNGPKAQTKKQIDQIWKKLTGRN